MSDYLRSAFGYLNGGSGQSATTSNDYVGQVIEISGVKLRVNRLIAEGGWALVYAVEDVTTGKEYALKRMIAADEDARKTIMQEIETLKALTNHPNIIQFLCVQQVASREANRASEILLVTELCPGGTVADVLRNASANSLSLAQICKIAYQASKAVHHMHSQQPQPFIHRDIKLENFLIGSDGLIKLCDFGSTTVEQILPDTSWSAQRRAQLEDHMAKFTTPMYRAPEMMDTWSNEPIGPPVDCWALGCVLYSLVTLRHPFPEGNKLAIVNGKFAPPGPLGRLGCFAELIAGCLQVSPTQRTTASTLLERLAAIAESNGFDPREPAGLESKQAVQAPSQPQAPVKPAAPPTRPAPPPPRPQQPPQQPPQQQPQQQPQLPPQQQAGLLSSLKGGAGSLFRNIKDTSSKVMQTVQQSMARSELDASYLTSRLLVMPYPADGIESAYRANHVEDVRAFLQARHPPPTKLQFYNLSRGRPSVQRLVGRHIDCSFAYASAEANAPLLSAIYQICQDIYRFLDADVHHLVVLYCNDGLRASAVVACSLLLYAGAFSRASEAIGLFTTRRCQPPQLQPSESRILDYMASLAVGEAPHMQPLLLGSLLVQPVPLFTKARDGCRPYVEIYSNGAMVYSSKRPEYEDMRLFAAAEGKLSLPLGEAAVRGDITMVLYHARQQLGRVIGIKMAGLHFHTGYVVPASPGPHELLFERKDLDDTPEIGGMFKLLLTARVAEDSPKFSRAPAPWEAPEEAARPAPEALFASTLEMEETLDNFRNSQPKPSRPPKPPKPQPPRPQLPDSAATALPRKPSLQDDSALQQQTQPSLAEADLLNLGGAPAAEPRLDIFDNQPKQPSADLFAGFAGFAEASVAPPSTPVVNEPPPSAADLLFGQTNGASMPAASDVGDLLFGQASSQQSAPRPTPTDPQVLFDPFGSGLKGNLLGNWAPAAGKTPGDEGFPRNASVPNFAGGAQRPDPFANLANAMGAGLASSWNGKESNSPQPSSSPVPAGTPVHSSPRMHKPVTPLGETAAPFAAAAASQPPTDQQPKAKPADAFEDLLGSQGYSFASRKADKDSPKTINQMRKVEAAKTMDPEKMKVAEWTDGKKGNLRALLCSMHTILWDGCKWQKCDMHMLVSAADVKKSYRKACLAVHPDKQAGTPNENLAKLIFVELNNAWSSFENDASQQHLFS